MAYPVVLGQSHFNGFGIDANAIKASSISKEFTVSPFQDSSVNYCVPQIGSSQTNSMTLTFTIANDGKMKKAILAAYNKYMKGSATEEGEDVTLTIKDQNGNNFLTAQFQRCKVTGYTQPDFTMGASSQTMDMTFICYDVKCEFEY